MPPKMPMRMNDVLRYLLGVRFESAVVCHADLNIAPLLVRRHRSILRAFHRFTAGTATEVTQAAVSHSIFRAVSYLRTNRRPLCWALQLHAALSSFQLLDMWNPLHPLAAIRALSQKVWYQRVDDATAGVIHRWRQAEICLRPHLLCYDSFAHGIRFASYLYLNNPLLRAFITSLRSGSLLVQHCKPALRHRRAAVLAESDTCPFCVSPVRECTTHFLLHCSLTSHLRPAAHELPAYGHALLPAVLRDSLSPRRVALAAGMKPIVLRWYAMWRFRAAKLKQLAAAHEQSLSALSQVADDVSLHLFDDSSPDASDSSDSD